MTKIKTVVVWAIAIIQWARNLYLRVFPIASVLLLFGFVGGIEHNTINHTNVFPIVICYTLFALLFIICILTKNADERRYRPRHARRRR